MPRTHTKTQLISSHLCTPQGTSCHDFDALHGYLVCVFAQVWYCSVECQKTHWKVGGHKKQCKVLQAAARATAERGTPTAENVAPPATVRSTVGGSDVGACTICLDSEPPPIQSGCACRGDAGLAHVECRAMAAAHLVANSKSAVGWWRCATCGQHFTGAMQLGLAEAWWSTAQRLPEEDVQRLAAAANLASALVGQGRHGEAATLYREVLSVQQRVMGPDHPGTLMTANNLASALSYQGKHAEAENMHREVLVVKGRVLGLEHPSTLMTDNNLASALSNQGKHAEAATMHREALVIQRRVLGPEHPETLTTAANLAITLDNQGKHSEAATMYRELLPVVRRVLGPEHPHTLAIAKNLVGTTLRSQPYEPGQNY
jgi:hypothetical protein